MSLATRGKLSPVGEIVEKIVREQYIDLVATLSSSEITVEVEDFMEIESTIDTSEITTTIEVVHDIESEIEDEDIESDIT
jgi:hypothetical protein